MCVWRNFLRESAILLSRKKRANVFMKLFFLPPPLFFARNRSREKNFSNSYYKNERILRSTVRERYSFFCTTVQLLYGL